MTYDLEVMTIVCERHAMSENVTLFHFAAHLIVLYGYDSKQLTSALQRAINEGLIWVGQQYPRRGRPEHVVLTRKGDELAAELLRAVGTSSTTPSRSSTA